MVCCAADIKTQNKFTDVLRKGKKNENNETPILMHCLQEMGRCVSRTLTAAFFVLLSCLENLPLINSRKIIFSSLKCFFLCFCDC